ncbi:MAG: hypothetical protein CMB36_05500 [Euryarchaeota archaeon]|nr:hypothetical protein [Euryarchaeota archaeon]|tara:strand:- start:133 stop:351 length:219 start_codon:yes stop_codon:yes gene_type:complete
MDMQALKRTDKMLIPIEKSLKLDFQALAYGSTIDSALRVQFQLKTHSRRNQNPIQFENYTTFNFENILYSPI